MPDEMGDPIATLDNPVGTEILDRAESAMAACRDDTANYDAYGGVEVVENVLKRLQVAIYSMFPGTAFAAREIGVAMQAGFFAGVAAQQRMKDVDEQLRLLGLE